MPSNPVALHYATLAAMLAPAFFLTATASLLMSANTRLARVVDRLRTLLREIGEADNPQLRDTLERHARIHRRRSTLILHGSQLLYVAISFFVGTSLLVAIDSFVDHRLGMAPTLLAVLGVLAMFAASLFLARESALAVRAVNEELDHRHDNVRRTAPP